MAKQFRAFTEDFISHMQLNAAWPAYKNVRGMKTEAYMRLRHGEVVGEQYTSTLVHIILKLLPSDFSLRALNDFFANHGWPPPATLPLNEILDRICTPLDDCSESKGVVDWLQTGVEGMAKAFVRFASLDKIVQGCKDESEVEEAAKWFFIELGRLTIEDPLLPLDQAISITEGLFRMKLKEYQRRVVSWWQFNPWTVVFARGWRQPAAMSCCLPITAATYDAIMDGHMTTYECMPSDLQMPSSIILIKAAAIRPAELSGELGNRTRSLPVTITAQIGALTHRNRNPPPTTVRLLCVGGSKVSVKRLKSWGFVDSGRAERDAKVNLYVNTLGDKNAANHNRLFWSGVQMFGSCIYSPPPP